MNEELQGALTELINKSMNGVDAATGFLAEEIPDVVAQLLMWHGVYNFILFIGGLLIASMAILPFKLKTLKPRMSPDEARQAYANGEEWTRYKGSGLTTSNEYDRIVSSEGQTERLMWKFGASSVILVFSLFFINLEWLKIWIAPKVWLLEYAASLAK